MRSGISDICTSPTQEDDQSDAETLMLFSSSGTSPSSVGSRSSSEASISCAQPVQNHPSPNIPSSSSSSISSNADTEILPDMSEFTFSIPRELEACQERQEYPDKPLLHRFIRDCAACLQAVAGE